MDGAIHFFHCGDGDTILIQGGDQWALVDANFTNSSGSRDRLERVLDQHQVDHLRFVCITHFDRDHIRGLGRFLEDRFSEPSGPNQLRSKVEQIILPLPPSEQFWNLIYGQSQELHEYFNAKHAPTTELRELLETFRKLGLGTPDGHLLFRAYTPEQQLSSLAPKPPHTPLGPWEIWFLGPSREAEQQYINQLQRLSKRGEAARESWPLELRKGLSTNATSRILALCHEQTGDTVLLTGDAPATAIEDALRVWERVRHSQGLRPFRLVKASHHGAWTERQTDNCHSELLYSKYCKQVVSEVVVSCACGNEHHPHGEVVRSLSEKGIRTVSTGAKERLVSNPRTARILPLGFLAGAPATTRITSAPPQDVVFKILPATPPQLVGGHERTP